MKKLLSILLVLTMLFSCFPVRFIPFRKMWNLSIDFPNIVMYNSIIRQFGFSVLSQPVGIKPAEKNEAFFRNGIVPYPASILCPRCQFKGGSRNIPIKKGMLRIEECSNNHQAVENKTFDPRSCQGFPFHAAPDPLCVYFRLQTPVGLELCVCLL